MLAKRHPKGIVAGQLMIVAKFRQKAADNAVKRFGVEGLPDACHATGGKCLLAPIPVIISRHRDDGDGVRFRPFAYSARRVETILSREV